MPLDLPAIKQIAKHEFGHSLSLLHQNATIFGHEMPSVMFPILDSEKPETWQDISDYDLAAIYTLYGEDGFSDWYLPLDMRQYG